MNAMNNIPISIWYDWHNDGTNKTNPEHNFGTVQFEYKSGANPVYKHNYYIIVYNLSAKTITSNLKDFHYVKRIATNDFQIMFCCSRM